ncbi:probable serine/threonine-protein kinase PBL3 isoform X1 [Amborella trichopoda]|uniref:probable serine/threonine-protein kinase PBL3 isoform X1 n=1 Tax=Amborella trichopoda TaxID=13333 RepID=UPI0005D32284|nr:probable serine/threonine-protein kinase PBL3 isoform X1 [Amborella trichopoda]|eukprot:XP_011623105.1 probable serine/threonine-protein kinase PBL3 isoform X1 [Amborella trichopoda]
MGVCFSNPEGSITASKSSEGFPFIPSLPPPRPEGEILAHCNLLQFTYDQLKRATVDFDSKNFLGQGGFGSVYKGWINGQPIAVKNLSVYLAMGEEQWHNELDFLSRLHHKNLIRLIGYCSEGHKMLLVYEFMSNGSLHDHLFKIQLGTLPWNIRLKIALGAARGLNYMHEPTKNIVFRDFKSANILLDGNFNAKLSDFGWARDGPASDRTHVSTRAIGTLGYAAPEYHLNGHLSHRCDVYSFGVMLLELLTGQLAHVAERKETYLVEWTKSELKRNKKLNRIMDPRLKDKFPEKEAYRLATVAIHCVHEEPDKRPTMEIVVIALEEIVLPSGN